VAAYLKVTPKTFFPCGDDGAPDPAFFHTGAEGADYVRIVLAPRINSGQFLPFLSALCRGDDAPDVEAAIELGLSKTQGQTRSA
jgi:hypothetical protein